MPILMDSLVLSVAMLSTPASSNVNSSFSWLIPSWFRSRQIRRSANCASFESTMPSPFESISFRASKPSVATVPSALTVLSPNNSKPLSMVPLPSRSKTTMPSSGAIQPIPFLMPSPSASNNTEPSAPVVSMPSPSRSRTRGSEVGRKFLAF